MLLIGICCANIGIVMCIFYECGLPVESILSCQEIITTLSIVISVVELYYLNKIAIAYEFHLFFTGIFNDEEKKINKNKNDTTACCKHVC